MITVEELYDQKVFSDFVEKLQNGKTTKEENKIFKEALIKMSLSLKEIEEKLIK